MNILVTTDLSTNSKAGIRFALQLAVQTNSCVIVYHMMELIKPTSWSKGHFARFQHEETARRLDETNKFVSPLLEAAGINKTNCSIVVESGSTPSEMIISYAKKSKADFLCTSTRGAGMVMKLFGTTASAIITRSAVPVIVVPHDYKTKPLKKLMYASDFGSVKKELARVTELAEAVKAETEVYHYDYMLNVPEVEERLKKKATKYESPRVKFIFRKLEVDHSLSHHIRADIKRSKPSLVILFTKQHSYFWFDRVFSRSDAADMSFNAGVPLLTFRKETD
jgi:nucleotide-binding universal stress UspA family protein